jgi:hypothetical protein
LLNTMAADRPDDPEIGKMSADCIDYRSLLADETSAGFGVALANSVALASWSQRTACLA